MADTLWWSWGSFRKALWSGAASIAVHAALIAPIFVLAAARRPAPAPDRDDAQERWSGRSVGFGGERLVDVAVDPAGGKAPAEPASPPITAPDPALVAAPFTTATSAATAAPTSAPTAAQHEPAASAKPRPKKPKTRGKTGAARPGSSGAPATSAAPVASGEPGDGAAPGPFGPENPRKTHDVGLAFTWLLPPANQSDPIWSTLPVGDAGTIEITFDMDATGHIARMTPAEGNAPPAHLLNLVKRTLVTLESGTYALRPGMIGAGSARLAIRATLRDVEVRPGGDATGLSFAYRNGKGTVSFTQASGRRVEVLVRVLESKPADAIP